MPVSRLSLTDFRSYPDALIEPGSGLVVLVGDNGAGKTNILEAISLLAPGRGLRRASLSDMARQNGGGGFSVAARMGEIDLGTGTRPDAPERRLVRINGTQAAASVLSEWLSILWLTPAMDRLFIEGTGGRRRFLDRLVLALHPGHAVHMTRYEAAMRARNKLLTDLRPDAEWLTALEQQMADHAEAIASARSDTVALLANSLAAQPKGLFARADMVLADGAMVDRHDFILALRNNRARDAAAGRTLIGPHRSDMMVRHRDKDQPAENCSTGEQKALLLAIILAHADLVADRVGRRPIMLLDEVAAHLDPHRRHALFERLQHSGGQTWMTGTEAMLFTGIDNLATRYHIADGRID